MVLPEDSGPKISTTRPRGIPPMPSAVSRASDPVGMTDDVVPRAGRPSRMIEPLPNCRSICVSAVSTARHFSFDFSVAFTLDIWSPFSPGSPRRAIRAIIDSEAGRLRLSEASGPPIFSPRTTPRSPCRAAAGRFRARRSPRSSRPGSAPELAGRAGHRGLARRLSLIAWLLEGHAPAHVQCCRGGGTLDVRARDRGLARRRVSGRVAEFSGARTRAASFFDEIAGQLVASAVVPLFSYPSAPAAASAWVASFLAFGSSTSGNRAHRPLAGAAGRLGDRRGRRRCGRARRAVTAGVGRDSRRGTLPPGEGPSFPRSPFRAIRPPGRRSGALVLPGQDRGGAFGSPAGATESGEPLALLGMGSNVLAADGGFPGGSCAWRATSCGSRSREIA